MPDQQSGVPLPSDSAGKRNVSIVSPDTVSVEFTVDELVHNLLMSKGLLNIAAACNGCNKCKAGGVDTPIQELPAEMASPEELGG